jgi:hypothetical protein
MTQPENQTNAQIAEDFGGAEDAAAQLDMAENAESGISSVIKALLVWEAAKAAGWVMGAPARVGSETAGAAWEALRLLVRGLALSGFVRMRPVTGLGQLSGEKGGRSNADVVRDRASELGLADTVTEKIVEGVRDWVQGTVEGALARRVDDGGESSGGGRDRNAVDVGDSDVSDAVREALRIVKGDKPQKVSEENRLPEFGGGERGERDGAALPRWDRGTPKRLVEYPSMTPAGAVTDYARGEGVDPTGDRALDTVAARMARAVSRHTLFSAQDVAARIALGEGVRLLKQWVAVHDSRTRHAHLILDGQQVLAGEPFKSELGPIMWPGDPDTLPENRINCRCVLLWMPESEKRHGKDEE